MDEKNQVIYLKVDNELCSVHMEGERTYYIFYSDKGKYNDFKVEVYE